MSALTWGSLAFFLAVLLGGSVAVGWTGWTFWRQLQATMDSGSAVMDDLATRMEALDAGIQRMERRSDGLHGAVSRLSHSAARARVLLASAQESREAISGWLRFLPRV